MDADPSPNFLKRRIEDITQKAASSAFKRPRSQTPLSASEITQIDQELRQPDWHIKTDKMSKAAICRGIQNSPEMTFAIISTGDSSYELAYHVDDRVVKSALSINEKGISLAVSPKILYRSFEDLRKSLSLRTPYPKLISEEVNQDDIRAMELDAASEPSYKPAASPDSLLERELWKERSFTTDSVNTIEARLRDAPDMTYAIVCTGRNKRYDILYKLENSVEPIGILHLEINQGTYLFCFETNEERFSSILDIVDEFQFTIPYNEWKKIRIKS